MGVFLQGFFSVVEREETINSGTAHPHRKGMAIPASLSRVGQSTLFGALLVGIGHSHNDSHDHNLNLGSRQHPQLKHVHGTSAGDFSCFSIRLKGTPPNYDDCLLCLSASQASGKCVRQSPGKNMSNHNPFLPLIYVRRV